MINKFVHIFLKIYFSSLLSLKERKFWKNMNILVIWIVIFLCNFKLNQIINIIFFTLILIFLIFSLIQRGNFIFKHFTQIILPKILWYSTISNTNLQDKIYFLLPLNYYRRMVLGRQNHCTLILKCG